MRVALTPSRLGSAPPGPRTFRAGIDPPPGLTSIDRALVRNGLIQPRSRRRTKASYRRWERARPMELWQMDIMGGIWLTDYFEQAESVETPD